MPLSLREHLLEKRLSEGKHRGYSSNDFFEDLPPKGGTKLVRSYGSKLPFDALLLSSSEL
jgi:hypothetical protein